MKKEVFAVLSCLLMLSMFSTFVAGVVISGVTVNNMSMVKSYQEGESIRATINLSLNGIPADSKITTNLNQEFSLLELIRLSSLIEGEDYSCSSLGCKERYVSEGEITQLDLDSGVQIIGFKINGNQSEIKSAMMDIQSNTPESCSQQMSLAIASEINSTFQNYKYKPVSCGYEYKGCFNESLSEGNYQLSTIAPDREYCEKLTLPPAPAYLLKAKIINSTSGSGEILARLYDAEGNLIKGCTLSAQTAQTQSRSCVAEYGAVKQGEYFVCIKAGSSGTNYQIKSEQAGVTCGTADLAEGSLTRDYEISAEAMKYDSVNIRLDEKSYLNVSRDSLKTKLNDYLYEFYGGNCPAGDGCFIPLRVSGVQQNINFANIQLEYLSENSLLTSTSLYKGKLEGAKINSGSILIDLSKANFTLPQNAQNGTVKFYFKRGNQTSKSEINWFNYEISGGFKFSLNNQFALIGIPTIFKVLGTTNTTSVVWNFGDGSPVQTSTKAGGEITHKYLASGRYKITASVTKSNGEVSTRGFDVDVGDSKSSAEKLLSLYTSRIANLTKDLDSLTGATKTQASARLNLVGLSSSVNAIKVSYDSVSAGGNYTDVVQRLLELDIPLALMFSSKGSLPIVLKEDSEVSILGKLSQPAVQITDKEKTVSAVRSWARDNFDAEVSFESLSLYKDSGQEELFSKASIKLTKKTQTNENAYLIINLPFESISFDGSYNQKKIESSSYVPVSGSANINLILNGSISIEELEVYLGPDLNRLAIVATEEIPWYKKEFSWKFFVFGILGLIILFFVVYIVLQEWYKKNYESYLFKSKDELFNMLLFIDNGRKAGQMDEMLRRKLRETSWSGEQIDYAFKKIDGKRTGMYEIPIFALFEKKAMEKELERRRQLGKGGDVRFIK